MASVDPRPGGNATVRRQVGGRDGSPSRRSTVVELCGLPGSGKTLIANLLTDAMAQENLAVHAATDRVDHEIALPKRLGRKLTLVCHRLLDAPSPSVRMAARVAASQRSMADTVSRQVQWLVTQDLLATARQRGGLHLLDEGVVQALWSIGLRGDVRRVPPIAIDRSEGLHTPDVIVMVEASVDCCSARLRMRSSHHSRTERLSAMSLDRELRRGEHLLETLVGWCEETWISSDILRVANDAPSLPDIRDIVRHVVTVSTLGC
jgi:hypothetical protein